MKKSLLVSVFLLLLGFQPLSAQWSLQYLMETRTNDASEENLKAKGFALERSVAFIPFLRLSARVSLANFKEEKPLLGPFENQIGLTNLSIREANGTAMLGIPLGWLRVYGGYGWVLEDIKINNTVNDLEVSAEDRNFGLATVYGARAYLGKNLSVTYEMREVAYEKEMDTNAKKRTSLGFALHF